MAMLDGRPLIDAHQHPVRLPTVKPAWLDWAERYGQPGWRDAYSGDGVIIPRALDDLMRAEGRPRPGRPRPGRGRAGRGACRPRGEGLPGPHQRATKHWRNAV